MQFTKLRLSGFKSFVDQTELLIEPGMTGVVGPNGCGKSNLLEALRWAMGETSAKRMRGEDMDDVIFGGTTTRPARNIAEVTMVLGNDGRTAPPPFNEFDELEITRRLERGSGSDYRINGKLVRARDVQILFADNASGANSPALVSQGRVGALINAKPADRRQLLEEAAGISGLHARRHEAELRLRAAETNLTRLDDVLGTLDAQLQTLRKQAKQAARYRNVQENIRQTEARLLHIRWQDAEGALTRARSGHARADEAVRQAMLAGTTLAESRAAIAATLPPKRQAEADAAATLQRLVLAREQLAAEEARVAEAQTATQRRLAQIASDLSRERALATDADNALLRLREERQQLLDAQAEEALDQEEAQEALLTARDAVEQADLALAALLEQAGAEETARNTQLSRLRDQQARLATLDRRLAEQQAQADLLRQGLDGGLELAAAEEALALAEERLELAREEAENAEAAKGEADRALERARAEAAGAQARSRDALTQAESRFTRIKAECDGLRALLGLDEADLFPPLIDAVTVTAGYEQALAAALGDDLTAPLDAAANIYWRDLPPLPDGTALPDGLTALTAYVKAPAALGRCLPQIGVAKDAAQAAGLSTRLLPGQMIVTRDGGAWRWDGLTRKPGAPTAAAIRLTQRNRLAELEMELDAAEEVLATAREAHASAREQAARREGEARQTQDQAAQRDRQAREAVRSGFRAVEQARDGLARRKADADAAAAKLQALLGSLTALQTDRAEAAVAEAEAQAALDALPDAAIARNAIAQSRARQAELRAALANRQTRADQLLREAEQRRRRLSLLQQEEQGWAARVEGAASRLAELEQRAAEGREELETLAERPLAIQEERRLLAAQIQTAERHRAEALAALQAGEAELAEAEQARTKAETALADAREARAHAEAAVSQALQHMKALAERIAEKLDCEPDHIAAATGIDFDADEERPDPTALEQRLSKLLEERERIGPVNLRAEQEVAEMEAQIGTMTAEKEDLTAAIARLRQGINGLNREARERLLASFSKVDAHFQDMFTRLFGGGSAHLKLTEAEDPLDAGLEIYASPPGKKLQVLSLLSGGEQALTALALLFAVFLCNPAPICVLDEVDAPLDEANVGRFCDMVEEMARSGATRFLIVTHHRLTMARMDRLFGVTMMERGVSKLVSVDLARAAEMVES